MFSFNKSFERVTYLDRANAGGGTGKNHIAFVEGKIFGDMTDQRLKGEYQIAGMAVLDNFAVFLQLEMNVGHVRDVFHRHPLAEWCGAVESFGDFPGMAFRLQSVLNVTGCKINTKSYSIVIAGSEFRFHRATIFGHPQHDFAFIMQVFGIIRVINGLIIDQQRRIRLHKNERLPGGDRVVEFFSVFGVVAPDAEYFHTRGEFGGKERKSLLDLGESGVYYARWNTDLRDETWINTDFSECADEQHIEHPLAF